MAKSRDHRHKPSQCCTNCMTLLAAQAHLPPTELVEAAGFTATAGTIGPLFDQFDDGKGSVVPPPDDTGFRNEPIRQAVLKRLNASAVYR
jgi:cytochrome c peroxidase